jgi:hypothetical protein
MVFLSLLQHVVTVCFILEKHNASIFRVNKSGSGGCCNNLEEKSAGYIRNMGGILTNSG